MRAVFNFHRVTPSQVSNIIDKAKPKISSGWDEVSMWLIKRCKYTILDPLTKIINQSLKTGQFPEKLKYGIVSPIFKGGTEEISNFRPICLLPTFSKILESIVREQLVTYIEKNNMFSSSQHGFRSKRSTNSALIDLTNHVLKSLDDSKVCLGMMCDLSKAFDCVRHDILLAKLECYGIKGQSLQWFASYLQNRKQQTRITVDNNKLNSEWKVVPYGVPQGSVLGPLLFLLYINDLPIQCKEKIVMYADDTTALVTRNTANEVEPAMSEMIKVLDEWFSANGLNLNKEKTSIINFKTKMKVNDVSQWKVDITNRVKLLGLVFDTSLKWKEHIDYLTSRLNTAIFNMSCLIASRRIKLMVYFAYFESIIRYGIIVWGRSNHWEKIFKAQKRMIRVMMGMSPRESCKRTFRELGILTFPGLYLLEVVKYVHENIFTYQQNNVYHHHDTRNKNNLRAPKHRLRTYENSPYYSGIQIYNRIPQNYKSLGNAKQLYRKFRQFLVDRSYYSVSEFLQDEVIVF